MLLTLQAHVPMHTHKIYLHTCIQIHVKLHTIHKYPQKNIAPAKSQHYTDACLSYDGIFRSNDIAETRIVVMLTFSNIFNDF